MIPGQNALRPIAWPGRARPLCSRFRSSSSSFTPFGIAIAVLYVVVLLLANQVASRNALILIAAGCMILTIAGFLLDHGDEHINEAAFRALISLAAIAITTALLLRGRKVIAALEESEARYRMFLNISAVSFWRLDVSRLNDIFAALRAAGVTDLKQHADDNPEFVLKAMEVTTVADVNDKCVEMFGGKTRDDLIGRSVRDFWPEGRRDVFINSVEAGFRGESGFQTEARVRTLDGREVDTLFCMAAPPEIRARGMVLVANIDISEQVEGRAALARMQSDLAHAARLSMLGEFTASIAHEVNQPLAAIAADSDACTRWLCVDPPNVERAKLAAERITTAAVSAGDVVRRIRALFQHISQPRTLENANLLIEEVCRLMADEVGANAVRITTDLDPNPPMIALDRVQIQQVLMNLIRNGIQAMDKTEDSARSLDIRSCRDGSGAVRIEVRDAGSGFSEIDRVFEPFFTTKKDGMGMGLAICRSIVESHGGQFRMTNNDARGATVAFTLSMAEDLSPGPQGGLG